MLNLNTLGEQLVYLLVERLVLQQLQMLIYYILVMAHSRTCLYIERVLLYGLGDGFLNEGLEQRIG
nr:hypothetical protein [Pontibacter sp. BAB1700]